MNQLNVSLQHSITTLAAHGWSHRRIARALTRHAFAADLAGHEFDLGEWAQKTLLPPKR